MQRATPAVGICLLTDRVRMTFGTERGEVLGLLEISLPEKPSTEVLQEIARTAHLPQPARDGRTLKAAWRHRDRSEACCTSLYMPVRFRLAIAK